jgi:hypothetical protein
VRMLLHGECLIEELFIQCLGKDLLKGCDRYFFTNITRANKFIAYCIPSWTISYCPALLRWLNRSMLHLYLSFLYWLYSRR